MEEHDLEIPIHARRHGQIEGFMNECCLYHWSFEGPSAYRIDLESDV
jgi:hypothetical protein